MKSKSTPPRPHFFKVILNQTLRDRKLRIPPAFVTRYGKDIPSDILLMDPTGMEWKMNVSNHNGELWMKNGWDEFADHYSLCFGDFLVFRHEGDGHFHVIIFDKSASEIRYPSCGDLCRNSSPSCGFRGNNMETNGDAASVDVMDNSSQCKRTRERPPLPCTRPYKIIRSRVSNTSERNLLSTRNDRDCRRIKASTTGDGRLSDDKRYLNGDVVQKKQLRSSSPRKVKALQRAPPFVSKDPFFIVTMCPTYTDIANRLRIPRDFAERYLGQKSCEVILCYSGRTWTVEYHYKRYSTRTGVFLQHNWRSFVQDNHLRVGDACIFELLKGRNHILKVRIHRAIEAACNNSPVQPAHDNVLNQMQSETRLITEAEYDPSCNDAGSRSRQTLRYNKRACMESEPDNLIDEEVLNSFKSQESKRKKATDLENNQNGSCLSNRQGLKDSELFISNHPFFEVFLQKYHFPPRFLNIPSWFLKNLALGDQYLRLETKTGSWDVKLLRRGKIGRLSGGLAAFLRENSVRADDVFIFELIDSINAVFKVSIIEHAS